MNWPDIVNVLSDQAADGEPPDFQVLIGNLPCRIQDIGGDESYRGRQIEARTTHVVHTSFLPEFQQIPATAKLEIVESPWGVGLGLELNINHVRLVRGQAGRRPMVELYCTQLAVA